MNNSIMLAKLQQVLVNSLAAQPEDVRRAIYAAGKPTVMRIEGPELIFSSNGVDFACVEQAWLADDEDTTIPAPVWLPAAPDDLSGL